MSIKGFCERLLNKKYISLIKRFPVEKRLLTLRIGKDESFNYHKGCFPENLFQLFCLAHLRRLIQQCDHLLHHLLPFGLQHWSRFGLNLLVHFRQADSRVIPEKDPAG